MGIHPCAAGDLRDTALRSSSTTPASPRTPASPIPPLSATPVSDVFQGCTTWLDVSTLTWEYGTVLERIELDVYPDVVDLGSRAR